jgi:hypothetical protein
VKTDIVFFFQIFIVKQKSHYIKVRIAKPKKNAAAYIVNSGFLSAVKSVKVP